MRFNIGDSRNRSDGNLANFAPVRRSKRGFTTKGVNNPTCTIQSKFEPFLPEFENCGKQQMSTHFRADFRYFGGMILMQVKGAGSRPSHSGGQSPPLSQISRVLKGVNY